MSGLYPGYYYQPAAQAHASPATSSQGSLAHLISPSAPDAHAQQHGFGGSPEAGPSSNSNGKRQGPPSGDGAEFKRPRTEQELEDDSQDGMGMYDDEPNSKGQKVKTTRGSRCALFVFCRCLVALKLIFV
jgi:hypothetical protein